MALRLQIALDRVANPTQASPGLPGEWSPNGCFAVKVEGDQAVVRAPEPENEQIWPALMFLLKTHFYTNYEGPNYLLSVFLMRIGFISCFVVLGTS